MHTPISGSGDKGIPPVPVPAAAGGLQDAGQPAGTGRTSAAGGLRHPGGPGRSSWTAAELALRFARDYAAMWDQRYSRLALAVENQDRAAALDAIISLRITSAMVGGLRLARLAEMLETRHSRRETLARARP